VLVAVLVYFLEQVAVLLARVGRLEVISRDALGPVAPVTADSAPVAQEPVGRSINILELAINTAPTVLVAQDIPGGSQRAP